MRQGTPLFQPLRLREAREARGLTVTKFAKLVDLEPATIYAYEKGKRTPRGDEGLERLAAQLNVPADYFLAQPRYFDADHADNISWRSVTAATKSTRVAAARRLGWLREIVGYLQSYVNFPTLTIPKWEMPTDPALISDTDVEVYAGELRKFWGLGVGPITNVVWLLESKGFIVARDDFESTHLDGFSFWQKDEKPRPFIVLGKDKGVATRSRFDAAHEAAHLLLHHNINLSDWADKERIQKNSLMERQAHRFAGAFLLPSECFALEVRHKPFLDSFKLIKPRWRVSIKAMIMRCGHLELISEEEKRRMLKSYCARGWHKGEPGDSELWMEQPVLLMDAFTRLVENRVLSADRIARELRLAPRDVEDLAGLNRGFLNDSGHAVRVVPITTLQDMVDQARSNSLSPESPSSVENSGASPGNVVDVVEC